MNMPFPRVWPLGVRLQLMFWYTAVFAVLIFFSDMFLYTQLQTSLLGNLDTSLQQQAEQVSNGITTTDGSTIAIQNVTGDLLELGTNAVDQQGNHADVNFGSLVRILDTKGHLLRETAASTTLQVPSVSVTQALQGTPWQGNVTTTTGQQVRLYSMALTEGGTHIAVVQVGESLAQLNAALHSVFLELVLIAPCILLLGALGSYWLASRAFVPIDRLTRTTRQIQAGDLHQRVPVPRTRDEVHRLATTLNEMISRLDEAFRRQRRFVADASHELRTPVAVIRSMTELALFEGMTPQEYKQLLGNINSEAERLGHLISELLALARSDEGKTVLELEPVRLDQLVEGIVANAEILAMEHNVLLHVQAAKPVTVIGDEARLIQALINVLDNAIVYSNEGGLVTISVEQKENTACLTIRDTGIGIAPEHIPHLFERFYRVDPARVRTDGNSSGLGLAIVEWVIHAHGGSITVESQVGQGSSFLITLPLAPTKLAHPDTLTLGRSKAVEREHPHH
ncbi:MAG: ATP-binding protein [Ktedonobacteraceae bacterium]